MSTVAQTERVQQALERLRTERAALAKSDFEEGVAAGIKWATDTAEYAELQRLKLLTRKEDWDCELDMETVSRAILGDEEVGEFWEINFGVGEDCVLSSDYLRGIVIGALEIFEQV